MKQILLFFIIIFFFINSYCVIISKKNNKDISFLVPNSKNIFKAPTFEKEVQSPLAINTTTVPFSRGIGYYFGNWSFSTYAFADIIFDHQFLHKQNEHKIFSSNNFLFLIKRKTSKNRFNLRTILSLEPKSIGPCGYPLLFSKAGTADHITLLINRFPAHDFTNEISFDYSYFYDELKYSFIYLALPGTAALGPLPVQRISSFYIPEGPITYNFLDSTHISYGVIDFGIRFDFMQLEASIFNGKLSEINHWHFKKPNLNSFSTRLSFYFNENFIAQVSYGHIKNPYEFEPDVNIDRITASISYNQNWGRNNFFQATFAWGRNNNKPGPNNDGFLAETCLNINEKHIFNTRFESIDADYLSNQKDIRVNKLGFSYLYSFDTFFHIRSSLGASVNVGFVPDNITGHYRHPFSYFLFAKFELA